MICTIYLLTNKINNKVYVGQTWLPLKSRMGPSGCNYKNSVYLYSAIQKYGAKNFFYQPLAYCETQGQADKSEVLFISIYNSKNSEIGYNLKDGGSAGKHSKETKAKISKTLKAKIWSSQALLGRNMAGKLWKGKKRGPQTEERKAHAANTMKEWHAINIHPMTGRHHSEEAKFSMGLKLKGRKCDPEIVKQRSQKLMMSYKREVDIVEAYEDGKTIAAIELEFQTSRSSIYRVLKRNNIVLRVK